MPSKTKNEFDVAPNENIKYPEGTFFAYYNGEYLVRHATESVFKKIVPWEVFNVTKPLMTKEKNERYKFGKMWIKRKFGWEFFSNWTQPSFSEDVVVGGIGYWIISQDFVVS